MKINRHNYEEYLIDFMDDNLSSNEVEAVMSFLKNNPDIKAEFEELNTGKLIADEQTFDKKHLLKKDPAIAIEGISKFEQLSIAQLENEITIEEEKILAELLKNAPQKQYEHKLIQKSKLAPDENIVFSGKKALKQYQIGGNRKIIYWLSSVAASVAVLVGFFLINSGSVTSNGVAINDSHFYQPQFRQPVDKKEIKEVKTTQDSYSKVIDNEDIDSVFPERINELVAEIDTRKPKTIASGSNVAKLTASELSVITVNTIDKNLQKAKVEDYVNTTLQKLGIEPVVVEKSLVAKAGESVWKNVSAFFRKRVQVKKVEIEDGRKLYAVRAGSLEFYTNTKDRKKKNKKQK
jgi:hypothetical protein